MTVRRLAMITVTCLVVAASCTWPSSWTNETVALTNLTSSQPGVAIAPNGDMHTAYRDSLGQLRYDLVTDEGISSEVVPTVGDASNQPRMELGPDNQPHVLYRDSGTDGYFDYSVRMPDGTWQATELEYPDNLFGGANFDVDSQGRPHVVFIANIIPRPVVHAVLDGGQWTMTNLDAGGNFTTAASITIDGADVAHVVFDRDDHLVYANESTQWAHEIIDEPVQTGPFASTYPLRGTVLVDDLGRVHVPYQVRNADFAASDFDPIVTHALRYARRSGGTWTTAELAVGQPNAGFFRWTAFVDGAQHPHVVYTDPANTVVFKAGPDVDVWPTQTIPSADGDPDEARLLDDGTVMVALLDGTALHRWVGQPD